jgi:hypothetical protein
MGGVAEGSSPAPAAAPPEKLMMKPTPKDRFLIGVVLIAGGIALKLSDRNRQGADDDMGDRFLVAGAASLHRWSRESPQRRAAEAEGWQLVAEGFAEGAEFIRS